MILLNKNTTTNNIALTLSEKVTLDPVFFLFEFVNDMSHEKFFVIATDTSTEIQRYNLFSITEGVSDPVNGSVILSDEGFYSYKVYEQTSSTNLDPTGLNVVESGKMKLLGVNQSFTKNNISTTYVVHDPTT